MKRFALSLVMLLALSASAAAQDVWGSIYSDGFGGFRGSDGFGGSYTFRSDGFGNFRYSDSYGSYGNVWSNGFGGYRYSFSQPFTFTPSSYGYGYQWAPAYSPSYSWGAGW